MRFLFLFIALIILLVEVFWSDVTMGRLVISEETAIEAVKRKCEWTKEHLLNVRRIDNLFFDKTKIYKVTIADGPEPSPIFVVAINEINNNSFVFLLGY